MQDDPPRKIFQRPKGDMKAMDIVPNEKWKVKVPVL